MSQSNSESTIISMAVPAIAISSLHEGVGHGLVSWLRGDIPTELTSNHLSDLRPDRLVDVGGTLVNFAAESLFLFASRHSGNQANLSIFSMADGLLQSPGWCRLLPLSGVLGLGDWQETIASLAHPFILSVGMSLFGAILYVLIARIIARVLEPFYPDKLNYRPRYNTLGRLLILPVSSTVLPVPWTLPVYTS